MELLLASKQWNKLAHFIFLIWLWSPLISETFACVCQKFQLLLFLTLNMFIFGCSVTFADLVLTPGAVLAQLINLLQIQNCSSCTPALDRLGIMCKSSQLLKPREKMCKLCNKIQPAAQPSEKHCAKNPAICSSLGKNIVQKISQLCKQFPLSFFFPARHSILYSQQTKHGKVKNLAPKFW